MREHILKIALVIPVYNRRETTLQALRSLSRIEKNGFEINIFVIDDNSTDGTSQAIRENYPDVKIIHGDGKLHYAGGTNRGIEKALEWGADFIVTMNDDAVFHEQFLKRMIETAKKNPRSVVGALLLLWNEPHKVFQVGQTWRTLRGGWIIPEDLTAFNVPQNAFEVECIVGNCVVFPAQAIRENGLMDEKTFPHGWGDAQYLMRMRKTGWRLLIEPKAYVWCEPNTYPAPLHELSVKNTLKVLFVNQKHPLNLKRQFLARWESAPNRIKAFVGFTVYLLQLLGKSLRYGLKSLFAQQS
jgi:GT2 family glycosyltransferase